MKKNIIISIVTLVVIILLFLLDKSQVFLFVAKAIPSIHNSFLTVFFDNFSHFHDFLFVVFISLILLLVFYRKKNLSVVVRIISAIVILGGFVFLFKKGFDVTRPNIKQLVVETSGSFPSGHSSSAVVLYGLLYFIFFKEQLKKYSKVFIAFSIIMIFCAGFARIYLGVHWVPDIIGGYVMGAYTLYMSNYLASYVPEYLKRRKQKIKQ